MNTTAKLTLGMFLFAGPLAMAGQEADQPRAGAREAAENPAVGDATAEDSQGKIVLEEDPTTVKEALERLSEQEASASEALAAAQKAFDDHMAAAIQQAANDLEAISRRAVAEGQLSSAAKVMEEILRLDPENKTALEFFKTIGRLDVVQKRLQQGRNRSPLIGKWRGRWGTTGNKIFFDFSEGTNSVSEVDGRYLLLDPELSEKMELIPLGDRLIVLGWNKSEGRDPRASYSSPKALPDHVGIAVRVK